MILIEAPYGERVALEAAQDCLEELRQRLTDLLAGKSCDDDEPYDQHLEDVLGGHNFHAWNLEGSVVEVLNSLENALYRLGVPVNG